MAYKSISKPYRRTVNGYRITFSIKSCKYRIYNNGVQIASTYNEYDAVAFCKRMKKAA